MALLTLHISYFTRCFLLNLQQVTQSNNGISFSNISYKSHTSAYGFPLENVTVYNHYSLRDHNNTYKTIVTTIQNYLIGYLYTGKLFI